MNPSKSEGPVSRPVKHPGLPSSVIIRGIERRDLPGVEALLKTREELGADGAKKRTALFEWLAYENPSADGDPTYFVAEENNEIIAFHGRMPAYFSVDGKKTRGYYVHDLYVHPESRKRGLGFWLTMALAKAIEDESNSFICLVGMTPLNKMMQRKRKYHEQEAPVYFRPIGLRREFSKVLGNNPLARVSQVVGEKTMWLTDRILLPSTRGLTVREIDRFDKRTDDLYEQVAGKLGISAWKDSGYLNWKYVDRPFRRETIFAAGEGDRLKGFMVLSQTPFQKDVPFGVILELVADPDDRKTVRALLGKSIRFFREKNLDSVRCTISNRRIASLAQQLFFYKSPTGKTILLGNLDRCDPIREPLSSIENWHLTGGESDAFMLSP